MLHLACAPVGASKSAARNIEFSQPANLRAAALTYMSWVTMLQVTRKRRHGACHSELAGVSAARLHWRAIEERNNHKLI